MLKFPHYFIYRNTEQFGDGLLAALLTAILNDNKIHTYLWYRKEVMDLVDCNKIKNPQEMQDKIGWEFVYRPECDFDGRSIIQKSIDLFKADNKINKKIEITRQFVPVLFNEVNINSFDVAINSKCGKMGKYREWPYFDKLKHELSTKKISYIDLDEQGIKGNLALNYVKNAKLYVGLDTGMSHYVSSVVNNSLIIQTGYSSIQYWSIYNYDYIELADVPCKNCCLKPPDLCVYDYFCMKNLTVNKVMKRIIEKI